MTETLAQAPFTVTAGPLRHAQYAQLAASALGTLLSRFPQLRLAPPAEQLTYRPGVLMNGLTALSVILR